MNSASSETNKMTLRLSKSGNYRVWVYRGGNMCRVSPVEWAPQERSRGRTIWTPSFSYFHPKLTRWSKKNTTLYEEHFSYVVYCTVFIPLNATFANSDFVLLQPSLVCLEWTGDHPSEPNVVFSLAEVFHSSMTPSRRLRWIFPMKFVHGLAIAMCNFWELFCCLDKKKDIFQKQVRYI